MTREYRDGKDTYMIYGVESTYGTGTPVAINTVSKLQNVSYTFKNNIIVSQGVGEGANATSVRNGNFDVSGSITVKPTEFHFLTFISGSVDGAGTSADPYKLVSGDNIGYSGTFIRTATFELGSKSLSNNKVYTLGGASFNGWNLSGEQGAELQLSSDFTARDVKVGTTLTGYTPDGRSTFTFTSGSVSWNSEEFSCTQFSVGNTYPSNYPREVFDRFVKQPTKGVRRYNWTLTANKHYDNGAGIISSDEMMNEFLGTTDHALTSGTTNGRDLIITIKDGNGTGKTAIVQLQDSYINDWAESPSLEGGVVSITINGNSLAGKEEDGDNVPLKWYDE